MTLVAAGTGTTARSGASATDVIAGGVAGDAGAAGRYAAM
jgi:hypothetical protein